MMFVIGKHAVDFSATKVFCFCQLSKLRNIVQELGANQDKCREIESRGYQ
jgi:hypothetical protein